MKRGLRIALTLAIVVMIASQVDLSVVRNLAERVAPLWLGAALAVLFGVRVLVAWRFKVLLGALGIDRSFGSLLQVTLVSNALGQMLPTGIGQDVIRGHHVVRSHGRGVDVSATIIQERLVGIGSMLVVGLIASLLWLEGPLQVWTASGIVAVGGVFLAATSYVALCLTTAHLVTRLELQHPPLGLLLGENCQSRLELLEPHRAIAAVHSVAGDVVACLLRGLDATDLLDAAEDAN